jgi:hypothetical protein
VVGDDCECDSSEWSDYTSGGLLEGGVSGGDELGATTDVVGISELSEGLEDYWDDAGKWSEGSLSTDEYAGGE